jgi:TM2 domain-containing membrane protein YozV
MYYACGGQAFTPQLIIWSAILLLLALVGAHVQWLVDTQWLAVPGGLILRKGTWRKRNWAIHLFDRREAVLMTYKHTYRKWALVVADASACETLIGTKQELDAALAAWLSPLRPPKPEQLRDWE